VVERWIPDPAVGGSIPSSLILCSLRAVPALLLAFQHSRTEAYSVVQTDTLQSAAATSAPVPPRNNQTKSAILLDLCVSSLRRGHANLLCIVPIFTDDHRSGSYHLIKLRPYKWPAWASHPEPLPTKEERSTPDCSIAFTSAAVAQAALWSGVCVCMTNSSGGHRPTDDAVVG